MAKSRYPVLVSRLPLLCFACLAAGCAVVGAEQAGAPAEAGAPAAEPEAPAREPAPPARPRVLVLQPLGAELEPEAVGLVRSALEIFYGFEVRTEPPRPLPASAFYEPRRRYRAERLLRFLGEVAPPEAHRVLGLTAVDISTTKGRVADWGIMGLATIDGRVSVMSMFRCARGARSRQHARERLAKVAVHEVGHTLGLEHCPIRGCLMEDARGTNTTTDREHLLCPRCRRILAARGYDLPESPVPPWPAPVGTSAPGG